MPVLMRYLSAVLHWYRSLALVLGELITASLINLNIIGV